MNTREETVHRQFDVVIERDTEGYYVASVPQPPGCHTPSQDLEFIGIQRVTVAA